jgi:hypothetical protein
MRSQAAYETSDAYDFECQMSFLNGSSRSFVNSREHDHSSSCLDACREKKKTSPNALTIENP